MHEQNFKFYSLSNFSVKLKKQNLTDLSRVKYVYI